MTNQNKQILSQKQVFQKIRRIAFEIYEKNFEEQTLVLAGIDGGGAGFDFATILAKEIQTISKIEVKIIKISFDKTATNPEVIFDSPLSNTAHQSVILVDDVLNTGKTLLLSLVEIMKQPVKKIQVAVIINREYNKFPVRADFIGYDLSTTMNDHVLVNLKANEAGVFLN